MKFIIFFLCEKKYLFKLIRNSGIKVASIIFRMKILTVSNGLVLHDEIKRIAKSLRELKISFYSQNDTLEVISVVINENPEVLIFDDDLFGVKSSDLLKNIRKIKSDLKIIFLTSDTGVDKGREVIDAGIYLYLIKPLEVNVLNETLASILDKKSEAFY